MMKNIDQIKNLLIEISDLLNAGHCPEWGSVFLRMSREIDSDPETVRYQIVSSYRGYSDLVLYENGTLLVDQTNKLDDLRNELFGLAKGYI